MNALGLPTLPEMLVEYPQETIPLVRMKAGDFGPRYPLPQSALDLIHSTTNEDAQTFLSKYSRMCLVHSHSELDHTNGAGQDNTYAHTHYLCLVPSKGGPYMVLSTHITTSSLLQASPRQELPGLMEQMVLSEFIPLLSNI
ncbi:MAG: hypothetical protein ABIJ34_05155 [archaeon]